MGVFLLVAGCVFAMFSASRYRDVERAGYAGLHEHAMEAWLAALVAAVLSGVGVAREAHRAAMWGALTEAVLGKAAVAATLVHLYARQSASDTFIGESVRMAALLLGLSLCADVAMAMLAISSGRVLDRPLSLGLAVWQAAIAVAVGGLFHLVRTM